MMENKKSAAAEHQFLQPQTPAKGKPIVAPKLRAVKWESPLRQLRRDSNVSVGEMVKAVNALYPGYDKPLHSKVENGDRYGIQLRPDAENLLFAKYAGIVRRTPVEPHRKKPYRVYARLTKAEYEALQHLLTREHVTMQDYIEALLAKTLSEQTVNN